MNKTNKQKPIASLSLDLDNQWSYMKIHGDSGWESFPSYLDLVVPRFLTFLEQYNLKITVFIVGQDAALTKNHQALKAIADAGHEIGNHSFHHEPWLHLYSKEEITKELILAEEQISKATGKTPIGFRGPGFSYSHSILEVLASRGYHYDASTFPSFLGPLARAYYFMTAKLSEAEKQKRKGLFGKFQDGFQPLNPYQCQLDIPSQLMEIPVTTMPWFKIPIHVSYILYLSSFSTTLALAYFKFALLLCKLSNTQLSLLLHPLDFLGKDDVPALAFFPGMNLSSTKKLDTVSRVIDLMSEQFTILTMEEHAKLAQYCQVNEIGK